MIVGDLVRAKYWSKGELAIVLSIRKRSGIATLIMGDYVFDQSSRDLEVISESR